MLTNLEVLGSFAELINSDPEKARAALLANPQVLRQAAPHVMVDRDNGARMALEQPVQYPGAQTGLRPLH